MPAPITVMSMTAMSVNAHCLTSWVGHHPERFPRSFQSKMPEVFSSQHMGHPFFQHGQVPRHTTFSGEILQRFWGFLHRLKAQAK